jgi:hypothetical protein
MLSESGRKGTYTRSRIPATRRQPAAPAAKNEITRLDQEIEEIEAPRLYAAQVKTLAKDVPDQGPRGPNVPTPAVARSDPAHRDHR